jgi:hypothetical protein
MKLLRTLIVFDQGDIARSTDWQTIYQSYAAAIRSIDFPEGSGKLKLRCRIKDSDGKWIRNGVSYLKNRFVSAMASNTNCVVEAALKFGKAQPAEFLLYPELERHSEPTKFNFGRFDLCVTGTGQTRVAIEWETGNISSSHRSLNKLLIALKKGIIEAGVLILPARDLYVHLTDRVGNINELSAYLSMWQASGAQVDRGLLAISVVEHDELTDDPDYPFLKVGNDGRAHEGKAKKAKKVPSG